MSIQIQGRPFNITVIQVYAPTTDAEEAEIDQFYEDLQHLLELTPKKDVLTMQKPLTVWTTTNYGKSLKKWECLITLSVSWEIYTVRETSRN